MKKAKISFLPHTIRKTCVLRIVLCLPFSRIFLSVSVLCQSVSASILLPQRYFVSARMSALPLFKRKTGVPHSRFCLFLHLFCPFLHLLAERTSPSLRACTLYAEADVCTFCTFCPYFSFPLGSAKKCFLSFFLS